MQMVFHTPNQPRTEFTKINSAIYDYSRVKAKRGPKHVAVRFKIVYKKMRCSTEKTQRKGDSLKNPEGDSPQNQQKNGLSGFIKNEV